MTRRSLPAPRKKDTRRMLLGQQSDAMVLLALVVLASILSVSTDGFCPVVVQYNHVGVTVTDTSSDVRYLSRPFRNARENGHYRLSLAATTSRPDLDGESADDDIAVLHEQIKQADPEWYREHVMNLLGDDYCNNRWPTIDLSAKQSKSLQQQQQPQEKWPTEDDEIMETPSTTKSQVPISILSSTALSSSEEEEEEAEVVPGSDTSPEELLPSLTAEAAATTTTEEEAGDSIKELEDGNTKLDPKIKDERNNSTIDLDDEEDEEDQNGKIVTGETTTPNVGANEQEDIFNNETDGQKTAESAIVVDKEEAFVIDAESVTKSVDEADTVEVAATEIEKETTEVKIGQERDTVVKENNGERSARDRDARALVYRNITGKTMSCVSLSNLLDLGYILSDLERIQAEFLSIVVLDQRRCPSMGIPFQWKIRDPRAKAEITLVDSMEEASGMAKRINADELNERDSIDQRRRRQEDRQKGIRRPPMVEDENDNGDQKSRRETDRATTPDRDGRGRRPEARRRPGRGRGGASDVARNQDGRGDRRRPRRSEALEDESPRSGRDRRRQRRREASDPNGNPRKIYRVPRDDTQSAASSRNNDPPDPGSPVWVNMETFRNLLRKEAEFRMSLIGDDWAETIEQENDWRTGLYQSWLWGLNNGVGESIVPPSRYERARRSQNRRMPREPPPAPPKRTRPPESRRRRREPERGDEPQPRQRQRRPRSEPRDPVAEEDNDERTDAPISATQRRSRRRAERRRGPPGK